MDYWQHTFVSNHHCACYMEAGRTNQQVFTTMGIATKVRTGGTTASSSQHNIAVTNISFACAGNYIAFSQNECLVLRVMDDCEFRILCLRCPYHCPSCNEFRSAIYTGT